MTCNCATCVAMKRHGICRKEKKFFLALVEATAAVADLYADAEDAGVDLTRPEVEHALDDIFKDLPEYLH